MSKEIKLQENEKLIDGKLYLTENFQIAPRIEQRDIISAEILTEAKKDGSKKFVLKPRIEAIHAGRTRNHNIYPAEKLKGDYQLRSGAYSFVYPYPKPMLKNHDHESEPTGRITNAQFISDSVSGKEAIIIIPEITDPETIEKALDGRYLTVSIGATTDEAICNICGTDIIKEGWCGHVRGETYDDVQCGWITGNLYFDECSWVNVPADSNAKVLSTGEPIVVEAYAQVDDKYYNLSSNSKQEMKESEAQMLGLIVQEGQPNQLEGGKKPMNEPNKDTVTLEEYNKVVDDKTVLETTIAEKDTTIAEKDALLVEKENSLQEATTKLQESEVLVQEKDTAIAEKDTTIAEKETLVEELNTKVSTLEQEVQTVTENSTTVKSDYLKLLVETVITFKEALGKPLPEDHETALAEHMSRSEESLKDSLADLKKEFSLNRTYTQRITNPGAGAIGGEPKQIIGEGLGDAEELSKEDVLKNLFSGRITK